MEWVGVGQVNRVGLGTLYKQKEGGSEDPTLRKNMVYSRKGKKPNLWQKRRSSSNTTDIKWYALCLLPSCYSLGLECSSPTQSSAYLVQYLSMCRKFTQQLPWWNCFFAHRALYKILPWCSSVCDSAVTLCRLRGDSFSAPHSQDLHSGPCREELNAFPKTNGIALFGLASFSRENTPESVSPTLPLNTGTLSSVFLPGNKAFQLITVFRKAQRGQQWMQGNICIYNRTYREKGLTRVKRLIVWALKLFKRCEGGMRFE